MHYLTLVTAETPALEADLQTDQEMAEQISALEQKSSTYPERPPVILTLALEACNNRRDTFSRAVNDFVAEALERYAAETDNPDYLEFCDKTEELQSTYQSRTDCIRLPEGRILPIYSSRLNNRFTIKDGKVYQCQAGPLRHEKRTKAAKRMKALPDYPISRLFPSFTAFAEEYYGYPYYEEQKAYGYYYNPDAFYDYYSIGGRWTDLFLVKDSCMECSIGARSCPSEKIPAPEGYKWVCAARKKDIEWQAVRDWHLQQAKDRFRSLEKLFLTGERDKDIYGTVTENGISLNGTLIYRKGDSAEEYLSRRGYDHIPRYPAYFYAFLDENGWRSMDDIAINAQNETDQKN